MALLTLSLGSNLEPAYHIAKALDGLSEVFGELKLSSVYESKAVGFDGGNFLNMVVAVDTNLALDEISRIIKALETRHGRKQDQARFSSRTLDIDILTLGDLNGEHHGIVLPRPEITVNAYVLWPMSEVCPDRVDPLSGQTYTALWSAYDRSRQQLWRVNFLWQGRPVSSA
ncbi:MAG: 2-amino-4-hydroxy-6-hydroxymethyldihydropteridine diphosphokinase [Pseudohongiella sp.]|nr:2-amino-4-hydroxy-6-hydroxymethyldihydropteridine diphosphokinase [Pseudohongiella sp.]MDO9521798.1 2-amino-4-hydroxy-6-hydroxymethyldihydropteridine diphosphokinase [Pseudohongiella sp.]MDP2128520.1 2-amino-4-hydroxy-6-hydroxymethyldihydropteridine diphosphokinase [Pseudohongiella sp.]